MSVDRETVLPKHDAPVRAEFYQPKPAKLCRWPWQHVWRWRHAGKYSQYADCEICGKTKQRDL